MTPLAGLGLWIWELARCERGDPDDIAARCARAGVGHVITKVGEESPNGQVTRRLVEGLRARGVECAIWWYCRPRSMDAQIAMLLDARDRSGVRQIVMDAEKEWDLPDQRATAGQFATRLRAALGDDVWLADAPWARPVSHRAPFPYREFGAVMNARMPQFYWELAEAQGEPFVHFVATADLEWAQTAPGQVICPAGSCVDYTGARHCPPGELAAFLDRYAGRPSCSVWSWQHLDAAEWAVLEQREQARRAALPVDVTDGGQDRPVRPPIDPEAT